MKYFLNFSIVLIIALGSGCTSDHLIKNRDYRSLVETAFDKRLELSCNRDTDLFSVINEELSVEQTEAMKFLYAFMPLNDLADYDGEFFLANVNMALLAKSETPWGEDIPDDIFLHYVLPYRVNNENLDSFRIVFYDEILNRIKGMNMMEAAMEINHWCREKVDYQPADIRTSAPMSTILSGRGRCGEESTFTVDALRTAGIPARQVYVPRWSHTDDNHAWVEIWSNGKWFYFGACEPEPVIDRGWFTEFARRAMMVNTKSFGAPYGIENTINLHNNFSEVNGLSKYAATKKIYIKVLDSEGNPAENANVEYQLYNYAEFYPLAIVPTDKAGMSQLETGLGDLLIWASGKNDFDFRKVSVKETDTLLLKLNRKAGDDNSFIFDMNVPEAPAPFPLPAPELTDLNTRRLGEDNMIRQKYIDSWIKPKDSEALAQKLNIDTARTTCQIARSMGNYNEIINFLLNAPDSLRNLALTLLEIIPDKDLRDITSEVLNDHLMNSCKPASAKGEQEERLFQEYILNPRIANEMVIAWRSYFREKLPSQLIEKAPSDPSLITEFLNTNITINNEENFYQTPLSPRGVYTLKVSDTRSRAICFVAICRSLGIPSRLEAARNIPQYYLNNIWYDVYFADQNEPVTKKGFLKLYSSDKKPVPEYHIHFTIARFENGRYNTLEYDFNKKITDFKEELALLPGSYMLVTGNRLNDSKILTEITFFNLSENEHKTLDVKLRRID